MTFIHIFKEEESNTILGHTSQCDDCMYRKAGTVTCEAFPKGIPIAIITGAWDHRAEWEGDGGMRYVPLSEVQ
jgi:hypothetical protein